MLKLCSRCGKIHERGFKCTPPAKYKRDERIEELRNSHAWRIKADEVKRRDKHMCLACKAKLPGTLIQYNSANLSVHHIVPLSEDYSLRMADSNLATLCRYHLEQAERGDIQRAVLSDLVQKSIAGRRSLAL